ncbi:hypothetical protein Ndes2526B_g03966 [Nannochloris sp. 'desiccata']
MVKMNKEGSSSSDVETLRPYSVKKYSFKRIRGLTLQLRVSKPRFLLFKKVARAPYSTMAAARLLFR